MTQAIHHNHGPLDTYQFSCRQDNYAVLVRDRGTEETVLIDVPEIKAVENAIVTTGWKPDRIWITHTHPDHIAGLAAIKAQTGATVFGPSYAQKCDDLFDQPLNEGDHVKIGQSVFNIWHTPGHAKEHLCYICQDPAIAFVGDVLFSLGCGRILQGTSEELWQSLQRVMGLADNTMLYCGHEYTLSNAEFACHVDPDHQALKDYVAVLKELRKQDLPTLPAVLSDEKALNPFLRVHESSIRAGVDAKPEDYDEDVFRKLRHMKDRF
jgi:hydroxyacylglutathione hydrolase